MKHNREKELVDCCEGIIRNASKIAAEYEHNQGLKIIISIEVNEAPQVSVIREFIPKEVIDSLCGVDSEE